MSYMVCVCNTRLVVALYVVMVMNELHGLCMQHTAGGCKLLSNLLSLYIWSMTMNELHGVYTYATHGWWLQIPE